MRQRTAHLEWRFAEDPDEWERLTGLPTSVTRHSLPRRIVWAGLLALLVLLGAGGAARIRRAARSAPDARLPPDR